MRTTIAALGGITVFFIGFFAISESAQQSQDAALNGSDAAGSAYNMSVEVFSGFGHAGTGIVWFGVAAVVVVALALLVVAGRSGRR